MKPKTLPLLLLAAGSLLFNAIFWQEQMGINTALFDAFLLFALFLLYPRALQTPTVRWLLAGHLLCLAMVIIHNTLLSNITFITTLILLAAFSEYAHRSAWFAAGSFLMNVIMCSASIAEKFTFIRSAKTPKLSIGKFIRFSIFPLFFALVFFMIYQTANNVFQEWINKAGYYIEAAFTAFTKLFSFAHLLFLLLGVYITGSLLFKSNIGYFASKEEKYTDNIQRARMKRQYQPFYHWAKIFMGKLTDGMLALKNENTTGIISLILLNALLAVINSIDISYLWFNIDYRSNEPAFKMVHEGAWLLILSIILAMGVLLFFFKGNLNFYKRNKWLKYGATLWLTQNMILVISVCLRDYYYITRDGLAYKRIGLMFFLLMVGIGLITMLVKIWQQKSLYYLLRINSWAGIILLVLSTCINWDQLIAAYNLHNRNAITLDVPFLLSLSDKTLILIDKNAREDTRLQQDTLLMNTLRDKEMRFMQQQREYSWLSWNYADEKTRQYLQQKGF